MQENAERHGSRVVIGAPEGQAWMRPRGGDFRAGDLLLAAGTRIDPWRLALAAAAGRAELVVARRPHVAILSTGPELAEAGAIAAPDQIYDSAGPAVAALARGWGATVFRPPPLPDAEAEVARTLSGIEADLLVTIGGASVGDHDVVRPALARLGLAVSVESVAMRPGKPTWFGLLPDGRRFLGLPGNPVSALVCAELFLRPLVLALQGECSTTILQTMRLGAPLPPNGPREHWMRARIGWKAGVPEIVPLGDQDSSLVSVLAAADALIRHPAAAPAAIAGQLMEALLLPNRQAFR
jgi:molybdopterin molybdotransferase